MNVIDVILAPFLHFPLFLFVFFSVTQWSLFMEEGFVFGKAKCHQHRNLWRETNKRYPKAQELCDSHAR